MTTSTITWKPVAEGLPDVESNVLLGLSSGSTCEGFLDTDHEGAQVWRDVCAVELEDAVVAWAEMPLFDSHADCPTAAPAPGEMVMVPREPTQAMCAAAVVFANGNAVYKNVHPEVLKLEESIYAEVYEAMIAAAPAPVVPLTDTRKLCTCDGAGRGPGRACVVQAGGRLGDLWKCAKSAAPVVREPLTEDALYELRFKLRSTEFFAFEREEFDTIARAIERAHGIGGGGK